MARRIITETKHPEITASEAELEALEGQKGILQQQVLAIAADKERLNKEFVDEAEQFDEKLVLQRVTTDAEIKKCQESAEDSRGVEARAMLAAEKATQVRDMAIKEKDEAVTAAGVAKAEVKTHTTEVRHLQEIKHGLSADISSLKDNLNSIKALKDALQKQYVSLQNNIEVAKIEINKRITALDSLKSDHAGLDASKKEKNDELVRVQSQVAEANAKILKALNDLEDAKKQAATHRADMAKKSDEINTRNANAAKLEQHVNEKLERIRLIESNFTAEHLARHGYAKT